MVSGGRRKHMNTQAFKVLVGFSEPSGIARYSWRTWSGWTPRIYGEFSSLFMCSTHIFKITSKFISQLCLKPNILFISTRIMTISIFEKFLLLADRHPPDPRAEITYRICQCYYLQYLDLEKKNKLNPY